MAPEQMGIAMTATPLPASLRATLSLFGQDGTPLTTSEVAAELDVSRRSCYDRLDRLVDQGLLATKKVGARGRVWWLPRGSDGGRPERATARSRPSGRSGTEPNRAADARGRSITREREPERDLGRDRAIVETIDDGIYVTNGGQFTMVNDEYVAMTGYDREELLGSDVTLVVDDATAAKASDLEAALVDGERTTARFEADLQCADGTTRRAEAAFTLLEGTEAGDGGTGDESDGAGTPERVAVVRDVTERVERERELHRQRERLAVLDELNAVVREIVADVVERSTRAEIERTLCERLAASDAYAFAWIGDVDAERRTVEHRVGAGAGDGLDGLTVSIDGGAPGADEPIARAIRSMRMQVAEDGSRDPAYEAIVAATARNHTGPVAAIPIVHEQHCYGVLVLAAARDDAFAAEEHTVVAHLGGVVGHAIAALDRKRALMSETIVELEFRQADASATLGVDLPSDCRLSLRRAVPIGDETFLVYGTANQAGLDAVRTLLDVLDHWEELRVIERGAETSRVQLRLSEPPLLAALADRGGRIHDFVLEDDEVYVCVHLAPGTRVRGLIDEIQSTYPRMEMQSRRQIERGSERAAGVEDAGTEQLTDRQLVVLEAAVGMGFFERPRRNSGEAVADELGITPATFHQHLRTAERRLVRAALDRSER